MFERNENSVVPVVTNNTSTGSRFFSTKLPYPSKADFFSGVFCSAATRRQSLRRRILTVLRGIRSLQTGLDGVAI